jgi:hypothetical protein
LRARRSRLKLVSPTQTESDCRRSRQSVSLWRRKGDETALDQIKGSRAAEKLNPLHRLVEVKDRAANDKHGPSGVVFVCLCDIESPSLTRGGARKTSIRF